MVTRILISYRLVGYSPSIEQSRQPCCYYSLARNSTKLKPPTTHPSHLISGVQRQPDNVSRLIARASNLPSSPSSSTQSILESEEEQRWEQQLREGRIKNVPASLLSDLLTTSDTCILLDVRPPFEQARAQIKGAIEIPVYLTDDSTSLSTFIKQCTAFFMGGWWLGGRHMIPNPTFITDVQARVPLDSKVIVGCQRGLRSLAACEALYKAGYRDLWWVNGGFDTARGGEVPTVDGMDVRLGGVGGVSGMMGFSEVQKELAGRGAGPAKGLAWAFATVIIIDVVLLAWAFLEKEAPTL